MKIRTRTNRKTLSRFNEIVTIFRHYGFDYLLGQSRFSKYNPFKKTGSEDP